ncbi:MAG: hypothetical protein ACI8UO_005094 [Verrucomicrobiales bacterium]|jgi:hypothetical protein
MITLTNPEDLKLRQVYKQARALAKGTSRASNKDWYRSALELDSQWHILIDGSGRVESYIYDRKHHRWNDGPSLVLDRQLEDDEAEARQEIRNHLKDIIKKGRYGVRPKSLGVVLHIADEFAIADLSMEFGIEEDFVRVRSTLAAAPREALGDSTLDYENHVWRLMPQWGIREGERRSIAVQLNVEHHWILDTAEEYGEQNNIPVISHALSAPLVALHALPVFLKQASGAGDIFLFHYPRFTALAVLDPHGELLQLRSLIHRGRAQHPAAAGDLVANTAAAMNQQSPMVHVVPMGSVDSSGLVAELQKYTSEDKRFGVHVVNTDFASTETGVPAGRPEFLAAAAELNVESTLLDSLTFAPANKDWTMQNFHHSQAGSALYPSRHELVTLKLIGAAKMVFASMAVLIGGYAGYEAAMMSRSDSWALREVDISAKRIELAEIISEDKRITYWESMMQSRSEAWLAMELALRLIPEEGEVLITGLDYKTKTSPPRNKAKKAVAYDRQWIIKGFARPQALAQLTQLASANYIKGQFKEIAETFGSDSFATDPETRQLTVTMEQQQGQYPPNSVLSANTARLYRNSFLLTITQSFDDRDQLALVVSPPSTAPSP